MACPEFLGLNNSASLASILWCHDVASHCLHLLQKCFLFIWVSVLPTHADTLIITWEIPREISSAQVTAGALLKGISFAGGSHQLSPPSSPAVPRSASGKLNCIMLHLEATPAHVPETALWRVQKRKKKKKTNNCNSANEQTEMQHNTIKTVYWCRRQSLSNRNISFWQRNTC